MYDKFIYCIEMTNASGENKYMENFMWSKVFMDMIEYRQF